MVSFNMFIKKIRKNKGYSLQKVGDMAGVSKVYLFDIERGVKPPPSNKILFKLVDALEITDFEERYKFFDLAAKKKNGLPADVEEIIKEKKSLIKTIRDSFNKESRIEKQITRVFEQHAE